MQFHTTGIVLAALTAVSAASAQTTQAVEWKVSEGGNGHWYGLRIAAGKISQSAAQTLAAHEGGHLLSACGQEYDFAVGHLGALSLNAWSEYSGSLAGPWIGLRLVQNNWTWLDGSICEFDHWDNGNNQPNGGNDIVALLWSPSTNAWKKCHDNSDSAWTRSYIVEWDSDCNNDGVVDYGQILRGELIDLNANGVPDICETSVSSVIPPSVPSQGGSTVTIRGNGFQANPTVRIGGVPATNIVRVSLTEITATSPALLPGMASVQVNDFTLQDGIYIRPDCGSDLDQNGAVDGGDMAILLLDWGPCYTTPSALAAPAPTPLLVPDESTPASTPPAPQSARPTPQPRGTAS